MHWSLRLCALALVSAVTLPAAADETLVCEQPHELDKLQLLRRLSLDLIGRAPSIEEYEALDSEPRVPESRVLELIQSDDFRTLMRRYHETLFWPNLASVRLNAQETGLGARTYAPPGVILLTSGGRAKTYRGSITAGCGDFQHTSFGKAFRPTNVQSVNGFLQEGWRLVTPYWDTSTQLQVCAFDAQETLVSDDGVACNTPAGRAKPECGCGPNLRFCYGPGNVTLGAVRSALREQLARAVDEVTTGGKPYTDLLLSSEAPENGVLSFWRRNLAPNVSFNATYNDRAPEEPVTNRSWSDSSWTALDRKGLHAGVLTLPAYLLRFQTDRGRANRFRIDFSCEHFVPPEQPSNQGCDPADPDLTKRCVCSYCHAKLEPMAAHFGLFAEAGSTMMTDPKVFPPFNEACKNKTSGFCGRFYVAKGPRAGWLQSLEFADVHPELETNAKAGPRALAEQLIASGAFARCTVKRTFSYLVKRELRAQGATTDELALLEELSQSFVGSGYSFPLLVHQIVSLPQYRRAR
jgi:hypothetical protein